jgi:hypothetical protein
MGGSPNVVIFSLNVDGSLAAPRRGAAGRRRPEQRRARGRGGRGRIPGRTQRGGPRRQGARHGRLRRTDRVAVLGVRGPDAATLRNGVFLTIGDIDGDGFADLVIGGGPRVLGLDGKMLAAGNVAGASAAPVANFFVGDESARGGVRIAAVKAGDVLGYLVTEPGGASAARVYRGRAISGTGEPADFQDLDPLGATAAGNPPAG